MPSLRLASALSTSLLLLACGPATPSEAKPGNVDSRLRPLTEADSCLPCKVRMTDPSLPVARLCSPAVWDAYQAAFCGPGCVGDCGDSFCQGAEASDACASCVYGGTGIEAEKACVLDASCGTCSDFRSGANVRMCVDEVPKFEAYRACACGSDCGEACGGACRGEATRSAACDACIETKCTEPFRGCGGTPTATCRRCANQPITEGTTGLCPDAVDLFQAMKQRTCDDPGGCAGVCAENFCVGLDRSGDCEACRAGLVEVQDCDGDR